MVAIVAGQGLGLFNTSAGLLGGAGQLGVAGQGRSGENVVVNASTGNLVVQQQDEWLVGVGPDAGIWRTYNSLGAGLDDNGDNWQLGLSRRITGLTGGSGVNSVGSKVTRVGEDGTETIYNWDAAKSLYVSKNGAGSFDTLSLVSSEWTWTDGDTRTKETYAVVSGTDARLTQVTDVDGHSIRLSYSANTYLITEINTWSAGSASGEKVVIKYDDANGYPKDIASMSTTYTGSATPSKRVSYTYESYNNNTQRRLKTVTVDLTPTNSTDNATAGTTYKTTYTYTDAVNKRLASIEQTDGSKLEFTYIGNKIETFKETVNGLTRTTSFVYDTAAGKTTITDPMNGKTELLYETAAGQNQEQLKQITAPAVGGVSQVTKFAYDEHGNVVSATDALSNTIVYRYDSNGNRIYERNALGNVVERVYSGSNLLLQETSYTVSDPDEDLAGLPGGAQTTRYIYDAKGHLRFQISATGSVTEHTYNPAGQRIGTVAYAANTFNAATLQTWQQDFSSNASGLAALPPSFAVTAGSLQVTSTSQSTAQWPGTSITGQPLGSTWRAEFTTPAVITTGLLSMGINSGSHGSAGYRRHFLSVSNGNFAVDVYQGASAQPQRQLGAAKANTTYVLEIVTTPDGGTTLYVHEKDKERSSGFIDARHMAGWGGSPIFALQTYNGPSAAGGTLGNTNSILVDNLSVSNPLESVLSTWANQQDKSRAQRTESTYNTRGQLETQRTYAKLDANGAGVSTAEQPVSITQYVHDQAGNLLQVIDGLNHTTVYEYDGLNRITKTTDALQNITTTVYTDSASKTAVTSANGLITTSTYDKAGRVTSVTRGTSGATASLGETTYTYDAMGRLTRVTQPTAEKSYLIYDAASRKVGEVDAEGALTEYVYDANNQIVRTIGYSKKLSASMLAALDAGTAGLPPNLITHAMSNWLYGRSNTQGAVEFTNGTYQGTSADGTLLEEPTLWIRQAGTSDVTASQTSAFIPVDAGKRYDVSVYTGVVNATASLSVAFYNGATLLNTVSVSTNDTKAGGAALSGHHQQQGFVTTPAGTTQIKLIVTKSATKPGQTSSALYVTHPSVALATSTQAAPGVADLRPILLPDTDRNTWNLYDKAGRLAKKVVSAVTYSQQEVGRVTEYRYDGAGHLIRTTELAKELSVGQLSTLRKAGANVQPGEGQIVANGTVINLPSDATTDRHTRFYYNTSGQLLGQLDAENYLTLNTYDAAGRLTRVSRYAKAIAAVPANGALPTPVAQGTDAAEGGADQHTRYIYNARNQLVAEVDAMSYVTSYAYDAAGNRTRQTRHAALMATSSAGGATLLGVGYLGTSYYVVFSTQDQSTSYQYDDLNRLTRSHDLSMSLETTYAYDADTTRLSRVVSAVGVANEERTAHKRYDKMGRLVREISAEGSKALATLLLASPGATQAQIDEVWNQYGIRHEYDNAGRRIATIEPNGINGVEGAGHKTVFYYDQAGRLTHSLNALGEIVEYTYNVFGQQTEQRRYTKRLSSMVGFTGGLKSALTQAAQTTLSNLRDNNSDDRLITAYGRAGQVSRQMDGYGTETAFYYYNAFGEVATVHRPTSHHDTQVITMSTRYERDRRGLIKRTSELDVSENLLRSTSSQYDAFGRLYRSIDGNGNVNQRVFDKLGRVVTIIEPNAIDGSSLSTLIGYDAFSRKTYIDDALWNLTVYTYGAADRSMTITTPEGISTTTRTNRHGETVEFSDGRGHITRYTYNANGQLTESGLYEQATSTLPVTGTRQKTSYDFAGRVIETTDGLLNKVRTTYDAANRVLTRTAAADSLDLTSEYRYDGQGRAVWSKDASGVWTKTEYDLKGFVVGVAVDPTQIPGTAAGSNEITLVANPAAGGGLNLRKAIIYNADDSIYRVIEGVGANQKVTQYLYDELGRRVSETVDPDGLDLETTYTYDANDNVVARKDALEQLTRYVYDGANRLTYTVDATGAVVRNEYDAMGRPSRTTAYASRIALAGLGQAVTAADITGLLSANASLDQVTYKIYDADGRLTHTVDALGHVTERTLDNNGNVITLRRYFNQATNVGAGSQQEDRFTASPPAVTADDDRDQVEQFRYDAANRLTWHVDAEGHATQHAFVWGTTRLPMQTSYSSRVVYPANMSLLPEGVVPVVLSEPPSSVTVPYILSNADKDRTEMRQLDALGRESMHQNAAGYVTSRTYDALGRLKTVTRHASLTDLEDPGNVVTQYEYDSAGRLVQETHGAGSAEAATTRYVLDALGQRKQIIDPRGIELAETDSAWALSVRKDKLGAYVDASGNAKAAAQLTAGQKDELRLQYTTKQDFDAAGRLIKSTDPMGGETLTAYDGNGNAVKITAPNGSTGYFYFDELGRTTWHIDPMRFATQTTYDAFGLVSAITRFDKSVNGTIAVGTAPAVYEDPTAATAANATFYQLKTSGKDATTQIEHDKLGRQTKIIDAEDKAEETVYDALGNKKSFTNKLGGLYTYTHDRLGRVLTEKQPVQVKELLADGSIKLVNGLPVMKDVITQFTYDSRGNILTKTEGLDLVAQQRITTYTYDKLDRLKTTTGEAMTTYTVADGEKTETPVETRWYDARGNLIEVEAADKGRTLTYWDALNRKTAEVSPTGTLTQWDYADDGKVVAQRIYGDAVTVAAGTRGGVPLVPVSTTNVRETLFTYNANGQQTHSTVKDVSVGFRANGQYGVYTTTVSTVRLYDEVGNVIKETTGQTGISGDAGHVTYNYYDKLGNRTMQVDAESYVTTWEYDEGGNVSIETRYAKPLAAGLVSTNSTHAGLIAAVPEPANKRVIEYDYDRMGRKLEERRLGVLYTTLSATGAPVESTGTVATKYTYNAQGQVTVQTDALTKEIRHDYDQQGRLVKTSSPQFVTAAGGPLRSAISEVAYNALGLTLRTTQRGALNTVETDDQIVFYTYAKNGAQATQKDAVGVVTTFSVDVAGRVTRTSMSRSNADAAAASTDIQEFVYDRAGRQTQQLVKSKSAADVLTTLQTSETRYDTYGSIVAKGINGGWQEYAQFDKMGRMVKSNMGSGVGKAYVYDAHGNATLTIESKTTDIKSLTIDQIRALGDISGTETVYDRLNRQTNTYQAAMTAGHGLPTINAATAGQSVFVGNNNAVQIGATPAVSNITSTTSPFATGDISIGGVGTSLNFEWHSFTIDPRPYGVNSSFTVITVNSFPTELALGEGALRFAFRFIHENNATTQIDQITYGEAVGAFVEHSPNKIKFIFLDIYKRIGDLEVRLMSDVNTGYSYIKAPSSGSHKYNIGSQSIPGPYPKKIYYRGQPTSAHRLTTFYREVGSSEAYKSFNAYRIGIASGGYFGDSFEYDWSGLVGKQYEMLTVALDAAGTVKTRQSGILDVRNASNPVYTQASGPQDAGYFSQMTSASGYGLITDDGKLNFLQQGLSNPASQLLLRYRVKNSNEAWTAVDSSVAGNALGLQLGTMLGWSAIPGWFVLNQNALAAGTTYEFDIVAKTADGTEVNRARAEFSRSASGASTISAFTPYSLQNAVVSLTESTATQYIDVTYKASGAGATATTVRLATPKSPGVFEWDANVLVIDPLSNYDYEVTIKAYSAGDLLNNQTQATLRLGAQPEVISAQKVPTQTLRITPSQSGVAALQLGYRVAGTTGEYLPLLMTASNGEFRNDVAASIGLPATGSVVYEYVYDALKADGILLGHGAGSFSVQSASATANGAASRLDWVVSSSTSSVNTIHRSQSFNAYGEVISETDGRGNVTDFTYTNLGRLLTKQEAAATIVKENGLAAAAGTRATTRYYYDKLGRMVGVKDANDQVNTQTLLDSFADGQDRVLTEYHADGGKKTNAYDVFGNLAYTDDELNRRTNYGYDLNNRLTRIDRPQRNSGPRGYDLYEYDAAGNRISHTTTDGVGGTPALFKDKTYYDTLGRITGTTTAQGIATEYTYQYKSTTTGAGGVVTGGWEKTTKDAMTRTLVDQTDVFGRLVSHKDLGGHVFTYNYNHAGWLTSQTSLGAGNSGQNIVYEHYNNGYVKAIWDKAVGTYTSYEYDKNGNKTFEGYVALKNPVDLSAGVRDYYQYATVTYDALNRVKTVTDPRYTITYDYDAKGNRRRIHSEYHDGVNGAKTTQEYWYRYDNMDRFVVTMGSLVGGVITKGATGGDGAEIGYDAAGQRRSATYARDGHTEDYTYTADGYLDAVKIGGVMRSQRTNDLLGRVTNYQEFASNGSTVTYTRTSSYDKDHRTLTQSGTDGTSTYYYYYTNSSDNPDAATASGHGALARVKNEKDNTTVNTYFAYQYWDEAKQFAITNQAYNPSLKKNNRFWKSGFAEQIYDVNGHIRQAIDAGSDAIQGNSDDRSIRYTTNAQGLILRRDEIAQQTVNKTHNYYYLDGRRIGDVGNDGDARVDYAQSLYKPTPKNYRAPAWKPIASADFDQNFEPISPNYPGAVAGSYTVRSDQETLPAIAQAIWGDSAMWYLLAEANGLTSTTALVAGQVLTVPNKVTNVHNNSGTYRVYNAGEAIGDVSPTLPPAPPPPQSKKCGGFLQIIIAVVAIVIVAVYAPQLAPYFQSLLGPSLGSTAVAATATAAATTVPSALAVAAGYATAGALASVATQGLAMAMGIQDKFSWKGVALSALGAGVSGGLGASGAFSNSWSGAAAQAATGNAITQGIAVVTGLQEKFDWRGVAASAAGGAIGYGIGKSSFGQALSTMATPHLTGAVTALVNGGVQAAIFKQKPNWAAIAADAFGRAVGTTLAEKILENDSQQYFTLGDPNQSGPSLTDQVSVIDFNAQPVGSNETNWEKLQAGYKQLQKEPGFLRGLLSGQTGSVLDAGGAPGLSENVGAVLHGAITAPFASIKEVGLQYKDAFNLLTRPMDSYRPSSALGQSIDQFGAGQTLLDMGEGLLSFPVQPIVDLASGNYEKAGGGLSATVAMGFGLLRPTSGSVAANRLGSEAGDGLRLNAAGPTTLIARNPVELAAQQRLNALDGDVGKFRPGEAGAAAEMENYLGGRLTRAPAGTGADFIVETGPFAGARMDLKLTPDTFSQAGKLNAHFDKTFPKFSESFADKLAKPGVDLMPFDTRILTPSNSQKLFDFVDTLPLSSQQKIIYLGH